MTTLSLYDNYAGTFSANAQSPSATGATRFQSSQDGWATAIRWRRETGVNTPSTLRIWDTLTQSPVASITSVPAPTGTGWQTVPLAAPVFLFANREYRVSFFQVGSTNNCIANVSTAPAAPTPLSFVLTSGAPGAVGVGGDQYPNTAQTSSWFAVDLIWTDTNPGTGAPPTDATVNNSLDAWLVDNSENSHQASDTRPGLPWTTKQQVDAVRSKADGATGFDAIKAVADAVNAAVSGLPGTIAGAVTTITGQLTTLTGNTAQSGLATIGAISHDMARVFNHALDVLAGHVVTGTSSTNFQWVAGTPVDFDGAVVLTAPADAYLLEITTLPQGLAITLAEGVHVVFRAGWWCECLGGVGSERHFVDFEETWLREGTRRLGGCLVQLGPGGAGTITPYLLQPV